MEGDGAGGNRGDGGAPRPPLSSPCSVQGRGDGRGDRGSPTASSEQPPALSRGGKTGRGTGQGGTGVMGGAPRLPLSSPPLCPGEGRWWRDRGNPTTSSEQLLLRPGEGRRRGRTGEVCSCCSPLQRCRVSDGWISSGAHRTWVCNHKAAVPFRPVKGQSSVACSYTIICIFTLQLSLPSGLSRILGKLRMVRDEEAWCAAVHGGVKSRTRQLGWATRRLVSCAYGRLSLPVTLRAVPLHQCPWPGPVLPVRPSRWSIPGLNPHRFSLPTLCFYLRTDRPRPP